MKDQINCLVDWFEQNKRDFPWRKNRSPYAVLISEIMLQQTRADVVVLYFNRWMKEFPTLESLALADYVDVIKAWEGLGYYSRVRNLYKTAKLIIEKYEGKIPEDFSTLLTLPGIGEYIAGAIMNFAFQKRALAIDANVARVLSRNFWIEERLSTARGKKSLQTHLQGLLVSDQYSQVSEALIELGATVCAKSPKCGSCPMRENCAAHHKNSYFLPIKQPKKTILLKRAVAVIVHENDFLVKIPEKGKVMEDLYEFFYFSIANSNISMENFLIKMRRLGIKLLGIKTMAPVTHTFTRFRVQLFPFYCRALEKKEIASCEWVSGKNLEKLPFSSGHRKIKNQLLGTE